MMNLKKTTSEMRIYIKKRVIAMREQGLKNSEISQVLDIPPCTVANIVYDYKRKGDAIFQEKVRGRKLGEKRTLSPEQEELIYSITNTSTPEQHGIAACLWIGPAVQQLIKQELDIDMPVRTISDYMKRWGMSSQRPTRKNYKQDQAEVETFKTETYPEIAQKAIDEDATIVFIDETGINNQEYRVRGYSLKGHTPVVSSASHRESINMISAIGSDGTCRYMSYEESTTQQRFIRFLDLITRAKTGRKILAITDNLKVHHGNIVKKWLDDRKEKIELFFLPSYSPELNPDEYLNHILKQNIHSGILPKTKDDIKKTHNFMQYLKRHPEIIKKLFEHKKLDYIWMRFES